MLTHGEDDADSRQRFRSNELPLWITVIAGHPGNVWRRPGLPMRIGNGMLTSLQQRPGSHLRYYWLLVAETGI